MHIFEQEIKDGLQEQIAAKSSISYASVATPSLSSSAHNIKQIKALASVNDDDLYYVQSILVTSSWNKNDDIFDSKEVWAAKNTPEDKPTNLNHDENIIIGHITSNWPITNDGLLIDPDTPVENLPEKFHILTGSVIYKAYINDELKERTLALIKEIENGTKYVSMECFFKGFDYGLLDKSSGEYKILTRTEDTSHLSKHLRAYGGLGEHENYKIGRVLRNITFSGKGYVDKPANPDSIILNGINNTYPKKSISVQIENNDIIENMEKNDFSENNGVIANNIESANTETNQMNEEVNTTSQLEASLQAKENDLQLALSKLVQCEAEAAEKMKNKDEEMTKKEEEMKKMKASVDELSEALAAYKNKEEEMMKKEKKNKRMASLLEAGVELAEAEATVDKLELIDDTAFETMTLLLAAQKAKKPTKEETMKEEASENDTTKSTEVIADESLLENVEEDASAIEVTVGGSDDGTESTRAALIDFVYSRLGKKLNKGE
jgi:hypothetical protein